MDAALQENGNFTSPSRAFYTRTRNSYSKARSSHQRCSIKKVVLRYFVKFTGKHLCQSLFLKKLWDSDLQVYLKKILRNKCFPVNVTKFPRATFLQNTSRRLLLEGVHLLKIPGNYL